MAGRDGTHRLGWLGIGRMGVEMGRRLLEAGGSIEQVDGVARSMKTLPPFISFDSWRPSIVEDVTRIMDERRREPFLRSSRLLSILAKENPR